jgi:hypothetical protein
LRKKSIWIISAVIALSAILLISAATIFTLNFSMNATVGQTGAVTVTIDSTVYNNGESLSINWSTVTPGETYSKDVIIHNGVNNVVTPALGSTGLPSGWTLTLNDTSTVAANSDAARSIVLTVPAGALAGAQSWSATFTASTS